MNEIAPSLKLLYRLMFDGGSVLSCIKESGEWVVEIYPGPNFDANELRKRYGKGFGPYKILLVPNIVEFYKKFYNKL